MTDSELPPSELVTRYLARHDWLNDPTGDEPPKSQTGRLWENWIDSDPERAWPIFVEFVRARPTDDDVLETVWRRLRDLLKRHGRAFHERVIALVASNARLTRIAPPDELQLAHYRPKPLDIPEIVEAYLANIEAHDDARELKELIRTDAPVATALILEIIERGPSHDFASLDTHSPLEDLLVAHGAEVIDAIELAAESSVLVRRCLWWISRGRSYASGDWIEASVFDRLERARAGATDYNTDDSPGLRGTLPPEYERIVDAWFACESTFWAWERTADLVQNDPEPAWQVIVQLITAAPNNGALGAIAAGPLEDLISDHGAHFIDRIEQWALRDERFRQCLRGVWPSNTSDDIWARVEIARGPLPDDDVT